MIYIYRTPKSLDFIANPNFHKKLKGEFDRAKVFFTASKKEGKFSFEVYKSEEIKSKLIQIFRGKCAYCDSSLIHITAGDIEHFRPKSIYWWLACDWHNLLFACEKCNRIGKNDAFPLLNNSLTQCRHDSPSSVFEKEELELRLLINPCKENPELYFQYDEQIATISPSPEILKDNHLRQMADTSIIVYRLQRRELVQEREKVLLLLLAQIEETKKTIENYNRIISYPAAIRRHFEERMKEAIHKLLLHNKPERQYLGYGPTDTKKVFS